MVNLISRKTVFINGQVKIAGWKRDRAEVHIMHFDPKFKIGNETGFILIETKRLRLLYPKVILAPLIYLVEGNKLHF